MNLKSLYFVFFLFAGTIHVSSQSLGCNISTITPTDIFYSGPPSSFTSTLVMTNGTFYLCENAIVYDTLVGGDRTVMINSGAQFTWGQPGMSFSSFFVKSGGTLIFKSYAHNLSMKEVYVEPGAIIIDPSGVMMTGGGILYNCSVITFTSSGCFSGLSDYDLSHSVSIYPIPATDQLHVSITGDDFLFKEIELKDCLNKTVMKCHFKEQIDLSYLNNGIYFLHLKNNTGIKAVKKVTIYH